MACHLRCSALIHASMMAGLALGGGELNVHQGALKLCSQTGMAMTGFTRDGRCADVGSADAGAHHVCIQMKEDFCTVTGQPDWCTTRDFPCMGKGGMCKIGNWCVCQWAFSRYLEKAGGCDSIVDLVCDATNMATFTAYSRSNRPEHIAALDCIKKRCPNLVSSETETTTTAAAEGVTDTMGTCSAADHASGNCK